MNDIRINRQIFIFGVVGMVVLTAAVAFFYGTAPKPVQNKPVAAKKATGAPVPFTGAPVELQEKRLPLIDKARIKSVVAESFGLTLCVVDDHEFILIDAEGRPATGTIVYTEGRTTHVQQFRNGAADGVKIEHTGTVTNTSHWKSGTKHGAETIVRRSTMEIDDREYVDGVLVKNTVTTTVP